MLHNPTCHPLDRYLCFTVFGKSLALIVTVALPESIRDQTMAETIVQHAEENGHEDVLILVGDTHVEGVASHLEKEEWDIASVKSNDSIMRISRELRSLFPD
jgi:hypothetical protein